jgi:hypothetical protein
MVACVKQEIKLPTPGLYSVVSYVMMGTVSEPNIS